MISVYIDCDKAGLKDIGDCGWAAVINVPSDNKSYLIGKGEKDTLPSTMLLKGVLEVIQFIDRLGLDDRTISFVTKCKYAAGYFSDGLSNELQKDERANLPSKINNKTIETINTESKPFDISYMYITRPMLNSDVKICSQAVELITYKISYGEPDFKVKRYIRKVYDKKTRTFTTVV